MIKKRFKYIDLFAGIGGFHQAMRRLGGRCVYACEKNADCKKFYDLNYRSFYIKHRKIIDEWDEKFHLSQDPNKLHRKFEWNCGVDCADVKEGIIQIRQSGIRVKRPDFFPSLVVMNNTPIIWDAGHEVYRYITPQEAAKLQSFDDNIVFLKDNKVTYKQLGNSVNVNIIELLASRLFDLGHWRIRREKNV